MLRRHMERLGQIALELSRPFNDEAVARRKLFDTEHVDDVFKFFVAREVLSNCLSRANSAALPGNTCP